MANNKVQLADGTVLIDLTTTTLSDPSQLENGVTACDRAGNVIIGTASGSSEWTSGIYQDLNGFIRVSPNAGAAGITLVSNYLVVAQ